MRGHLGDGCGGAALSIVYHVLWQVFGTYVLMQLFTAVILENFSEMAHDDTAAGQNQKTTDASSSLACGFLGCFLAVSGCRRSSGRVQGSERRVEGCQPRCK